MTGIKVVKLEDVDVDALESPSFLTKKSSISGESRISSGLPSKSASSIEEKSIDESEEQDKVYPLPENWPKIDRLKNRPKSCYLSQCRTG